MHWGQLTPPRSPRSPALLSFIFVSLSLPPFLSLLHFLSPFLPVSHTLVCPLISLPLFVLLHLSPPFFFLFFLMFFLFFHLLLSLNFHLQDSLSFIFSHISNFPSPFSQSSPRSFLCSPPSLSSLLYFPHFLLNFLPYPLLPLLPFLFTPPLPSLLLPFPWCQKS